MGYIKTLEEAKQLLAERQPFTTGTLSANIESGLDTDGLEIPVYVVRSYGVAISKSSPFFGDAEVYPTAYTHSKTTSKHANIVKRAWNLI